MDFSKIKDFIADIKKTLQGKINVSEITERDRYILFGCLGIFAAVLIYLTVFSFTSAVSSLEKKVLVLENDLQRVSELKTEYVISSKRLKQLICSGTGTIISNPLRSEGNLSITKADKKSAIYSLELYLKSCNKSLSLSLYSSTDLIFNKLSVLLIQLPHKCNFCSLIPEKGTPQTSHTLLLSIKLKVSEQLPHMMVSSELLSHNKQILGNKMSIMKS